MLKRHLVLGVVVTAAILLLPVAPAMADGRGFRPLNPFGVGHGLIGAAVALATLPLTIASSVVSSVAQSGAAYPTQGYGASAYGYAPPVAYARPQPYYAPYPGYYAPRVGYGSRPYYGAHPGNYGRGYYRSGGHSYPRR